MNLIKVPIWAVQGLNLTKTDITVLAEDLDKEIEQNVMLFEL
jgi:hypothetical protein